MHQRGLPVLIIFLLLGIVLKEPFLTSIILAILVIVGIAWWWRSRSLDGIRYHRHLYYTRGFPGERIHLALDVENKKFLPVSWLRIKDEWENAIGPEDDDILAPSHIKEKGYLTNLFSLRWYEKAHRAYTLQLRKRGIYTIGPATLETGDLFGIFDKSEVIREQQYISVFPTLLSQNELQLPAEDPFGDHRSQHRLYEDVNQPTGTREYRPEDGFRRVHWPATARTGKLQVKTYQPTTGQILMICLNVSTFAHHWEGLNPELLEHLVKVAATIIDEGIRNGYKVGLVSNGCLAHADQPFRVPPGRSPQQLAILLQALAGVTSVVTGNFDRFLLREVPRIQYGATLVILTSITTDELATALIQLKKHERKIMLFSIAEDIPPVIPRIKTIHQPFAPDV